MQKIKASLILKAIYQAVSVLKTYLFLIYYSVSTIILNPLILSQIKNKTRLSVSYVVNKYEPILRSVYK
jgi:hypothetical protein